MVLADVADRRCLAFGSTTWKREDALAGLEPDECFYLGDHVGPLATRLVDLTIDPPPDLVVEIEVSHPVDSDRFRIYAGLKVLEVWRFNVHRQALDVFLLSPDGQYAVAALSRAFP